MKKVIKKIRALECIIDWSLWPRQESHDLDSANLRNLKQALESGEKLPPIIIDEKSYRVVDGFHRRAAVLRLYGNEAEIKAELRSYENDAEMFKEAMELNKHGLGLSPSDKVYCILKARRFKIPLSVLGKALSMSEEAIKLLEERRTATISSGEKIPVNYGAIILSDYEREKRNPGEKLKPLTEKEEKAVRTSNGVLPIVKLKVLLNILRANAFFSDLEFELLSEIKFEIDIILERRAAA